MQYRQLFVADTARAIISFVRRSTLPGCMIAFKRVQQSSKCSGLVANARQMLGTRSIFFVALMSAKTARILGWFVLSSTSLTVLTGSFLSLVPCPPLLLLFSYRRVQAEE